MDAPTLAGLLALDDLVSELEAVEARMVDVLTDDRYTDHLVQPGLRVVQGGGKRLRPVLTVAAAALGDSPTGQDVVSAAVAVELVQVGSLVHDDVMDHAESRRGVPTVNIKEGANWAILVGDHLLAVAGMEAARVSAEVAAALARTIADLADGQAREVVHEYDVYRTVDDYLQSIRGKTAALIRCACEVGARAGRVDEEGMSALVQYGENFGMAFQIIDDVLDVVATTEALGKPAGNDVPEGVFTLPVLLAAEGMETSVVAAGTTRELLAEAGRPDAAEQVLTIVRSCGAVDAALEQARSYNREAAELLSVFGDHPTAVGLAALPERYLRWSMDRVGLTL
jgi:heptaprenyl diphosphate synthase/octaprenyl-diphosphate synthase